MKIDKLIDLIAEEIYLYEGGGSPEDYEKLVGKEQPLWKVRYPYQNSKEKLSEERKDDYRWQAKHVIQRLKWSKVIDFEVMPGEEIIKAKGE